MTFLFHAEFRAPAIEYLTEWMSQTYTEKNIRNQLAVLDIWSIGLIDYMYQVDEQIYCVSSCNVVKPLRTMNI